LRDFLLQRKQGASGKRFRILFTTEKALSVAVIRKEFDRTLFQLITEFAVFLPSLHERSEDHPLLLRDLLVELGAKQPESSVWLVNAMSRSLWSGNISELKKSLASLLAKQSDTRLWTASMVASWGGVDASTFEALDVTAAENQERQRRLIQGTLLQVGGDRTRAAFKLGLSREELLRRMFQMGLR